MPVTRLREWDCYFDARAEDLSERLKALVNHPSGTSLRTSADGLRWREHARRHRPTHSGLLE